MNPYLNLVGLFVFGAILLTGNLIIGLFWKVLADRHGDPRVVAFAQRTLSLGELVFSLPGHLLLAGSAVAIALLNNLDLQTLWTRLAVGVFGLGLLLWLLLLLPLQIRQTRTARVFTSGGSIPDAYWSTGRVWTRLRMIQILLLLAALGAVIFKPV